MTNLLSQNSAAGSLTFESIPADCNPVLVYLGRLNKGSHRTILQSLNAMAVLLSNNPEMNAIAFPWSELRYQHTSFLHARLKESYEASTGNKMLSALRQVLKECWRLQLMTIEDYQRAADVKNFRVEKLPKGRDLSEDEVDSLMDVCFEGDDPIHFRDAAVLCILRCGLRREEVADLDLDNLNLNRCYIEVRGAKGNKDRVVPIPESAIPTLEDWLQLRGVRPGPLILPTQNGKLVHRRINPQTVYALLQRIGGEAALARFSPHDFRRTLAGDLLDEGVDLVTVQKILGHSDPATAARYDRRGNKVKQAAMNKLKVRRRG